MKTLNEYIYTHATNIAYVTDSTFEQIIAAMAAIKITEDNWPGAQLPSQPIFGEIDGYKFVSFYLVHSEHSREFKTFIDLGNERICVEIDPMNHIKESARLALKQIAYLITSRGNL